METMEVHRDRFQKGAPRKNERGTERGVTSNEIPIGADGFRVPRFAEEASRRHKRTSHGGVLRAPAKTHFVGYGCDSGVCASQDQVCWCSKPLKDAERAWSLSQLCYGFGQIAATPQSLLVCDRTPTFIGAASVGLVDELKHPIL